MNRAGSLAALREWIDARPWARYVLRLAWEVPLLIAVVEVMRHLRPLMPWWTSVAIGLCMIGYGLFLAVEHIRRPLLGRGAVAPSLSPPAFLGLGGLIVYFSFPSE